MKSTWRFLIIEGNVYAWGFADAYRLGTGSEDDQPQPKKLGGKWADKSLAKKVVCGTDFGVLVGVKKA